MNRIFESLSVRNAGAEDAIAVHFLNSRDTAVPKYFHIAYRHCPVSFSFPGFSEQGIDSSYQSGSFMV